MKSTAQIKNQKMLFKLSNNRYKIWLVSGLAILVSLIGLISSWLNPSIGFPLRPGLDFTGGTQIKLERQCESVCSTVSTSAIEEKINLISFDVDKNSPSPNLSGSKVQFLDDSKSLLLRLPFLSAKQGKKVIEAMDPLVGPFETGGQSIDTIGPTLGSQLLKSSLISLFVALIGIASYISIRFDKKFAVLALIALSHDVIIICGIFSWLGIFINLEINSLFTVALLTIAGYSVNDTVVVFDRIREINKSEKELSNNEKVDLAVLATLTRTLYTSGTTLLPLLALIFWGGSTLYWFAITLTLGVVIGSWSSIAFAPSLLSLRKDKF